MSLHDAVINKITNYALDNTSEKTEDEKDILKYGIEVLIMNISKLIIIYSIAIVLGLLLQVVFATITFGIIRIYASGLHVKGFYKCLCFSLTIFAFIIFASPFFEVDLFIKLIISVIIFIGIYIYSPADTEEKPYFDENNRKKLKISASLLCVLYCIIWIFTLLGPYSNYMVSTLLMQLLLIHPLTYKVLGRRYKNYMYEDEYM